MEPSRKLTCDAVLVTIRCRLGKGRAGEGPAMAEGLVLPRIHVMVLCDEVEQRPDDENAYNLLGVRTELYAPAFPYAHPQVLVYLQLTGHEGRSTCRVEVLRAATDHVIHETGDDEID